MLCFVLSRAELWTLTLSNGPFAVMVCLRSIPQQRATPSPAQRMPSLGTLPSCNARQPSMQCAHASPLRAFVAECHTRVETHSSGIVAEALDILSGDGPYIDRTRCSASDGFTAKHRKEVGANDSGVVVAIVRTLRCEDYIAACK